MFINCILLYNNFYKLHPECCYKGYVPMYEPKYVKNGMIKIRKKNYFADYEEFLEFNQNKDLKVDFKSIPNNNDYQMNESHSLDNIESQPVVMANSLSLPNMILSSG